MLQNNMKYGKVLALSQYNTTQQCQEIELTWQRASFKAELYIYFQIIQLFKLSTHNIPSS